MPQQNAPFSTRFLQSDGIPEYNALLDTNLGKRREFLLGNKKSLKLLQQTGAIARVEVKEENPNQYVVFMAEKNPSNTNKRVPLPTSGSGAPLVEKRSNKNAASLSEDVIKSSYATTTNTTHHSISPVFQPASLSSMTKKKAKTFNSLFRKPGVELPASLGISKSNEQVKDDEKDTREEKDVTAMMTHSVSSNALVMKKQQLQLHQKPRSAVMHRRSSPDLFVLPNVQSVSEIDELIRQKKNEVKRVNFEDRVTSKKKAITPTSTTLAPGSAPGSDPATTAAAAPGTGSSNATTTVAAPKGTVEHLLEHDGVYQSKIHKMKEQMTELEIQKNHLENEIGKLRKRIKGVNAVQENDIAVAHCSSIMQHRLMKAEEEYMKLIKAQQEVRKDVDTVRRELLSLRKVKKKLDMDIQDVTQVNEAIEDKIKSSKMIRTLLAEELSDLERKAEITQEERKLKLCPEEEVIVDVEKLMHAVSERNDSRMERHASMQAASVAAATSATAATSIASSESSISSEEKNSFHKNLYQGLNYTNAFRVIQNTLGFEEDIEKFIDHFISTEEQLLSKHKVIVYLQEEENELQKQLNQIVKESTKKNEHVRGSYQENMIIQTEIQTKMNLTFSRIESYQELKELRNQEHIRLRNIMQKCLDIVRAEKNLARKDSSSFVLNGSFSVATVKEVSSAVMLEMLQEKITEIAFQLKKFQHRHDRNRSSSSSSSKSMTLMNFVNTIEDTSATTNGNGTADGSEEILSTEAKRSNAFSKIVLGPREPSGSILNDIFMTVLPPSMDHDPRPETIHLNSISESPLTAPDHYQKRISTRYANEMSISASAVAAGVATGCALYQERLSMYRARENALDNSVGSTDSRNSILMPPNRRRKTISLKNSF